MITTVCKLSYSSRTVPPIVQAVQGDTGRTVRFDVTDFTIPAGATATYFIEKPSGEAVYNAATISGNSILCELTAQSLAEPGENKMQVRVILNDEIVTSFKVCLLVSTFWGIDAIESSTEMNIFDQAVEQATEQFQTNAEQVVEEVIESIPADYTALTEEVDELNERLDDVTGNEPIKGWINGKFVSTNGSTYNPSNPIDNADFRYVIIECSEGDKFTINGTGGGNPRLWAFADSNNNILKRSTANETQNELVLTAPEDATQLILNDKAKNKDSYYGIILKILVDETATGISAVDLREQENNASTLDRLQGYDGEQFLDKNNFEIGDILISALGWNYTSSTKRVRTKENYDLELEVGDIIKVKDATKASLFIGYQTSSTTYGAAAWVSEWFCDYGGKYCILIKELPTENVQTSVDALLAQLEIIKYNNNQQNIKINSSDNPAIMSANHRGMSRNAPENTIPAYKQSKRYGFDYIETDIAWTSDGVAVILHDSTINRTARNADGTEISEPVNISDITYEQALTYDFGIWKADKWAGTRIPTFEQLLTLCKKQGIKVLAEVKSFGYSSQRLTELIDIVKSLGAEPLVMWTSFEDSILASIKNIANDAPLGFISSTITETVINKALALKTSNNKVVLMSSVYTDEAIALCKTASIPLWVYTINRKATINSLPLYICGVTSDLYPVNVIWNEST